MKWRRWKLQQSQNLALQSKTAVEKMDVIRGPPVHDIVIWCDNGYADSRSEHVLSTWFNRLESGFNYQSTKHLDQTNEKSRKNIEFLGRITRPTRLCLGSTLICGTCYHNKSNYFIRLLINRLFYYFTHLKEYYFY